MRCDLSWRRKHCPLHLAARYLYRLIYFRISIIKVEQGKSIFGHVILVQLDLSIGIKKIKILELFREKHPYQFHAYQVLLS